MASLSCTPDFDDEWLVKDLRILAIQATPPHVVQPATSLSFPPVKIKALVADPANENQPVDWELWACPGAKRCMDRTLDAGAPADGGPAGDGGLFSFKASPVLIKKARTTLDKIEASFTLSPDFYLAALVNQIQYLAVPRSLCKTIPADPTKIDLSLARDLFLKYRDQVGPLGGVAVVVELRIKGKDRTERGFKRLVYSTPDPGTPTTATEIPNQNPRVVSVTANGKDIDPASWLVEAKEETTLLPKTAQGDIEDYWVQTADNLTYPECGLVNVLTGRKQLKEHLSYAYYVTAGNLSHASTGGKPSSFITKKKVTDITSDWTPGPDDASATVWIVARDNRGGVGWTTLEPTVKN